MNELAINVKAHEIVKKYNSTLAELKIIYKAIDRLEKGMIAMLNISSVSLLKGREGVDDYAYDCVKHRLATDVWESIIRALGVRDIMSLKAQKSLDRKIYDGQMPEVTLENVQNLFQAYCNNSKGYAEAMIREVYQWMRPKDNYKSNSQWKVEGRIILTNKVSHSYNGKLKVQIGWADREIRQIDRVFHLLSGKQFLSKGSSHPLRTAIDSNSEGETDLFRYKAFNNGNLHLWIKDKDLERQFNQVAGGGSLAPERIG